MKILHLKDALIEMKNGDPFSISFVTLDQARKVGGEIISIEKCMLASLNDELRKEIGFTVTENKTDFKKKPKHYENATRNILMENGHIKKVHIRLILQFNDNKVFY